MHSPLVDNEWYLETPNHCRYRIHVENDIVIDAEAITPGCMISEDALQNMIEKKPECTN